MWPVLRKEYYVQTNSVYIVHYIYIFKLRATFKFIRMWNYNLKDIWPKCNKRDLCIWRACRSGLCGMGDGTRRAMAKTISFLSTLAGNWVCSFSVCWLLFIYYVNVMVEASPTMCTNGFIFKYFKLRIYESVSSYFMQLQFSNEICYTRGNYYNFI